MRCEVVVDLQFGSTAKGKVCAYLARRNLFDYAVKVQSVQAGHTIYEGGKKFSMRTIPVAWVNPHTKLILGPGIFIDKDLLLKEIKMIEDAGFSVRDRLFLDYRANYIMPRDVKAESDENLSKKMGSTSEGAGSSLIRKIWRKEQPTRVFDDEWASKNGLNVTDTVEMINSDHRNRVLLEGCQGTMLSVHTSPYYPFCTSRECTVAGIASEAGIAPADIVAVHGVFRTYPIRVGGNSGATGSRELTWDEVRRMSGNHELKPEKTTVTQRERRIFEFSHKDFAQAIMLNKPTYYYLTFMDYVNYRDYGRDDILRLSQKSKSYFEKIQKSHGIYINWISTGEKPEHYISR